VSWAHRENKTTKFSRAQRRQHHYGERKTYGNINTKNGGLGKQCPEGEVAGVGDDGKRARHDRGEKKSGWSGKKKNGEGKIQMQMMTDSASTKQMEDFIRERVWRKIWPGWEKNQRSSRKREANSGGRSSAIMEAQPV